jgi:glycosyltransferase involved in cell wall biosynthesis
MSTVRDIVPAGVDDPRRPSGGNVYDRHVCRGLTAIGWLVHELPVRGPWPWADPSARGRLAAALDAVPDGGLVLVDGLVASAAPDVVAPRASRLRVVVLLHMPLGQAHASARSAERTVLGSACAVVTTSGWARQWVLDHYGLPPRRVHVAEPGVEAARPSPGSAAGDRLLCVGAVTRQKGHDVLVTALAELAGLPWTCQVVGSLDVAPGFVEGLRRDMDRRGIADRMRLRGPLTGADLDAAYAAADVLVLASRAETYGMVVAEALAHGLPVIASAAGGVPEALGRSGDGRRPGLLVRPGDARALAAALRTYLTDPSLRAHLREAAAGRRGGLPLWSHTTVRLARALEQASREPAGEPNHARRRTSTST